MREDVQRVFAVRSIVFIGEQRCPYLEEFDGLDAGALHILGEEDGEPIAAGRIRSVEGVAKLERIAVLAPARGRGLGHELVEFMLQAARDRGFRGFKMHAQAHLVDFYRRHGFEPHGELFQEAGIDHYLMIRDDEAALPGEDPAAGLAPPVQSSTEGTLWEDTLSGSTRSADLQGPEPAAAPWPPAPPVGPATYGAPRTASRIGYVGFWPRLWASILDSLIVIVLTKPILVAYYGWAYFDATWFAGRLDFLLSMVLPAVGEIAFWAAWGATPGKMAVHARIVDARSGGPPSVAQLVGRYLAYTLSTLPLGLGFLWIAWDPRKQGFHDKLARTVVIDTRSGAPALAPGGNAGPSPADRDDDWMPF